MATHTTSALTTAFIEGADVFAKQVLGWDIRNAGIEVRTNVKAPQALTKLTADGSPRPYRITEDYNGVTWADRILTVYQAKYDMQLDPEDLRNKYLATLPGAPFEQFSVQQGAKQFLDAITRSSLGAGVRNASGTAAADLWDGFLTIIAAEITATNVTPVATGAITSANAVTKVEQLSDACDQVMHQQGFNIYCSYDIVNKYRIHYRSLNGYGFNKSESGGYQLDGVNARLVPQAWMGTSQRLIATLPNNLVFGTDIDGISFHPTPYLNYLKVRQLMAGGCQIKDIDANVFKVNDQA
ncbi:MAG: hypothetical protein EOO14_11930 [Chitinophagaceae bacterium]|nr:MAG: hypothetical protein EOO14_11930 [Chitinophagaceae bacterium]